MGAVIDSSVIIAAERQALDIGDVLERYGKEPVAFASITASELLHGVHRARSSTQRSKREAFIERLLAVIPVLPFDLVVARIHARIWAELAAKGKNVGVHDLQIASTALAVGFSVATRDLRSFATIPGLAVLNW